METHDANEYDKQEKKEEEKRLKLDAMTKAITKSARQCIERLGQAVSTELKNQGRDLGDGYALGNQCLNYIFRLLFLMILETRKNSESFREAMQGKVQSKQILLWPIHYAQDTNFPEDCFIWDNLNAWWDVLSSEQDNEDINLFRQQHRNDSFFSENQCPWIKQVRLKNKVMYPILFLLYVDRRVKAEDIKKPRRRKTLG